MRHSEKRLQEMQDYHRSIISMFFNDKDEKAMLDWLAAIYQTNYNITMMGSDANYSILYNSLLGDFKGLPQKLPAKMSGKQGIIHHYFMNGIYAAHLDTRKDLFKNSASTGALYLLRDLAKAFPNESYDPLMVKDMILQITTSLDGVFAERHIAPLVETLNTFAKAGKIEPQSLVSAYKHIPFDIKKFTALAELQEVTPEVDVSDITDPVLEQYENAMDTMPLELMSPLYRIANAAEDEELAQSISTEIVSRMGTKAEGNTYSRMLATREMVDVMKAIKEDDPKLDEMTQKVLGIASASLQDAQNYSPRDENQALADHMDLLNTVAERFPQYSAEIDEIGTQAMALANTEKSKPDYDYNWGLVESYAGKLLATTAGNLNKEVPLESKKAAFMDNLGEELAKKALFTLMPKSDGPQ